MKNTFSDSEICTLFEDVVTLSDQMTAFAVIMHDSLDAHNIDKNALQSTLRLMSDLLKAQKTEIVQLQKLHLRRAMSR